VRPALPDPTTIPLDDVPAAIEAVEHAKAELERLTAMLWARLVAPPAPTTNGTSPDDTITDVREVARIVKHSVSWVRKNGHKLRGYRQPGGKGTRVGWSRRELGDYVNGSP
jgi:hypothetical protein